METKSILRRCTDKLFGGLNMSWPVVILFAVGSAVVTFGALVVPAFINTSFIRIGETVEAWILFAVIIMANCKKPLESALKTFVFFLISQPLIYLFQVPFSWMGWGIFMYYKNWFILTILTFPAAFIGWYIKKKNLLSLLILAPVLCLLAFFCVDAFKTAFTHFPRYLVTALFCLGQILLYLYAFTSKIWQKLLGLAVPFALAAIFIIANSRVSLNATVFLPDDPVFSDKAVVTVADEEFVQISIDNTQDESMAVIQANRYGETTFEVKDGEKTYSYNINIYEDKDGHSQVEITKR